MSIDLDGADALLMLGDSERNADLYYATRFRAPDPFVLVWTPSARILLIGDLELDRARAQAQVDRVLSTSPYVEELRRGGRQNPSQAQVLLAALGDLELEKLKVPADFPLETADLLRGEGFELEIAPAPLFPRRQRKTPEEIEAIGRALRAAERAMEAATGAIGRAGIGAQGTLYLEGEVLDSERVRRLIHHALIDEECLGRHTIVSGGEQGCDPHQEGSGPLKAGQTIIVDIFPQSMRSGYYGDITRTVFRGEAPREIRALYQTVQRAQEEALGRIGAGVDAREIHRAVQALFSAAGYETGEKDGYMQGFFHGTGHGLGLEIHEGPRIGRQPCTLEEGQVVTVEPGLYYRGLGGVRLEDVVVVREGGCENLTSFPKFLEL